MSSSASSLPPDVDARLDRVLSAWAAAHQITVSRAETIRREILEAAPGPESERKGDWAQAISPQVMIGASVFPPVLTAVYRTLADVVPGWPMPNFKLGVDYRPYLQVA